MFLAFLRKESEPAARGLTRFELALRVFREGATGQRRLITSALAIAEVRRFDSAGRLSRIEEQHIINALFSRAYIHVVDLTRPIAILAQSLGEEYNLRPADAAHLATALYSECDELLTWDTRFVLRVNRRPLPGLRVSEPY